MVFSRVVLPFSSTSMISGSLALSSTMSVMRIYSFSRISFTRGRSIPRLPSFGNSHSHTRKIDQYRLVLLFCQRDAGFVIHCLGMHFTVVQVEILRIKWRGESADRLNGAPHNPGIMYTAKASEMIDRKRRGMVTCGRSLSPGNFILPVLDSQQAKITIHNTRNTSGRGFPIRKQDRLQIKISCQCRSRKPSTLSPS